MRILIADDHEPVRRSIQALLCQRSELEVCAEAANGLEAVEMARNARPDVILMDISMPRMNGLEATRIIRRDFPECKVIIVSQNDPLVGRQQAIGVDAHGFISKSSLAHDLLPQMEEMLDGHLKAVQHAITDGRETISDANALFGGPSQMAGLMRAKDWSSTALGPVETWSTALRMMVRFMLPNPFPQLLWWGPEFCCLYNDAYVPVLGAKHPWALGRPTAEVWREVWNVLAPLVETPFHGGPATWAEDIPLELNRTGFLEETHFTIAYSPISDDTVSGGIGGVLATVQEITQKVVGERRIVILKDLGSRPAKPESAEEACIIAMQTLGMHPKDIPFALVYLVDDEGTGAHFAASAGIRTTIGLSSVACHLKRGRVKVDGHSLRL